MVQGLLAPSGASMRLHRSQQIYRSQQSTLIVRWFRALGLLGPLGPVGPVFFRSARMCACACACARVRARERVRARVRERHAPKCWSQRSQENYILISTYIYRVFSQNIWDRTRDQSGTSWDRFGWGA